MENIYIKNQLQELLNRIPDYFEPNELAYYSAHCKNEQQIRDKIAWKLHLAITQDKKYGDKFVVRREWAPEEHRECRVDLAILEMDDNREKVKKVIALIEFKAHSIARPEPSFYCSEFKRDVEKMLKLKDTVDICRSAELYFVFLETGQDRKADKYQSVLGFSQYQTSKCVYCKRARDKKYLDAIKSHWTAFNEGNYRADYEKKCLQPISIPEPEVIKIGEAFGYTQYVSPFLIGPLDTVSKSVSEVR